ncbi:actin-related protein 9-like isoform X2 [Alnus glutinosa]|uniref:actin-related protein 9-like isoform X2 n=1 Tax=Alnus glutinosa TaxID=3517 RepID=UPI002D768CF2|nr:actin-related protein 9-like isoform X2 [Alnus glutinosa]
MDIIHSGRKEAAFTWTDIYEKEPTSSLPLGSWTNEVVTNESVDQHEGTNSEELISSKTKFRQFICGEEALKISPKEPYCLQRPVRRGHLNISQHYPMQQLLEDLHAIWDCILIEKLHIPLIERNMYSAILVVPETFDNRGLTSRVHH